MFAHYRAFKLSGIYDNLIISFCLGDDHFAVFKKGTVINNELLDKYITEFGLISKIKVVQHII